MKATIKKFTIEEIKVANPKEVAEVLYSHIGEIDKDFDCGEFTGEKEVECIKIKFECPSKLTVEFDFEVRIWGTYTELERNEHEVRTLGGQVESFDSWVDGDYLEITNVDDIITELTKLLCN